jgi:hypothetical protein
METISHIKRILWESLSILACRYEWDSRSPEEHDAAMTNLATVALKLKYPWMRILTGQL